MTPKLRSFHRCSRPSSEVGSRTQCTLSVSWLGGSDLPGTPLFFDARDRELLWAARPREQAEECPGRASSCVSGFFVLPQTPALLRRLGRLACPVGGCMPLSSSAPLQELGPGFGPGIFSPMETDK